MTSLSCPTVVNFSAAVVGLRPLIRDPDISVGARLPDGSVELRFNGLDGSYLAATIVVPSHFLAKPKLKIVEVRAWYAPTATLLDPGNQQDPNLIGCYVLLMLVDYCCDAVMDALGPEAQHAAWWTETPPIGPTRKEQPHAAL